MVAVEPVGGLGGGDEVHAVIGQGGRLGRPGHAREPRIGSQQALSRVTHFGVGLNGENAAAGLQQDASQDAGARAGVSNDVIGGEAAFLP